MRRKFLKRLLFLTAIAMLTVYSFYSGSYCHAKEQDILSSKEDTSEDVQDAGEPVPTRMITKKDGYTYILDDFNDEITSQFVEWEDEIYYLDKKGRVAKGWYKIENHFYYFSRTRGICQRKKQIDGIYLKKDGTARLTDYSKEKIQTMITARKLVEQHTSPKDSKKAKIKKCFKWLFHFPYHRYRTIASGRKHSGWEMKFANDIFKRKDGCCVSEACAFAFLAKECGAGKLYVCDDTEHAWTEIDGRVYDPLFAEAKSFQKYYNVSYRTCGLHAVNRTKI